MTKYKRPLETNDNRTNALIKWCALNIDVWPTGISGYVVYQNSKLSNCAPTKDYRSLSYSWTVCTKQQWKKYRETHDIELEKEEVENQRFFDKQRNLINWCAENIDVWPEKVLEIVSNDGKMNNLKYIYIKTENQKVPTCTYEDWKKLQKEPEPEKETLFQSFINFFKDLL